ncbi:hypothetical protein ACFOKI_01910 [Sphingomonas qilianensis]|uniref:Uncharacterized protein n=1 Tax=Sphingomonas qilianensis TaxID=1736690 RepID=A0ABU9XS20_9SPHN
MGKVLITIYYRMIATCFALKQNIFYPLYWLASFLKSANFVLAKGNFCTSAPESRRSAPHQFSPFTTSYDDHDARKPTGSLRAEKQPSRNGPLVDVALLVVAPASIRKPYTQHMANPVSGYSTGNSPSKSARHLAPLAMLDVV